MAAASCGKTEAEAPLRPLQEGEIAFGAGGFNAQILTRSVNETTISTLEEEGFAVTALYSGSGASLFTSTAAMDEGYFRPQGGPYFYPEEGTLDFHACYPPSQSLDIQDDGEVLLHCTASSDADIAVASKYGTARQKGAVQLDFSHILCQSRILCRGRNPDIVYFLKEIKVLTPSQGTYSLTNEAWSDNEEMTTVQRFSNAAGMQINSLPDEGTPAADWASQIPGEMTLDIVWDCRTSEGGYVIDSYERYLTLQTEPGKKVIYTLTLGEDVSEIKISTKVTEWETEDISETVTF